jgi:endonuclease/exonuclease/phosphatase family metal-dependent hydrolase
METVMKKLIPLLVLALMLGCQEQLVGPEAESQPVVGKYNPNAAIDLTVMTRNLYIGGDVDAVLETTDPDSIPILAAYAYAMLEATDFSGRMRAIAEEIASANPDLVGLQEVYIIRTETPGDYPPGPPDATVVQFDFLQTLLAELANLGANYVVAGSVENSDVEVPRFDGFIGEIPQITDVRVTDFDVVLARSDVQTSNVLAANYSVDYNVFGTTIKRGYIILDAEVDGQSYRFVNTHPEPTSTANGQVVQAHIYELLQILGSMGTKPTIVLGDMNTHAPPDARYWDHPEAYDMIVAAGYEDVWASLDEEDDGEDGLTCCHLLTLDEATPAFYERVDLIWTKDLDGLTNAAGKLQGNVRIVGKYDGRTDLGLWPSDHAGVVAELHFPNSGR